MSWFTSLTRKLSKQGVGSRPEMRPNEIVGESLIAAIEFGDLNKAKGALSSGLDPNCCHALGWPALIMAIEKGQTEIAEYLLESGADPNTVGGGETALIAAIDNGNVAIVRRLVGAGADVSLARSRDDRTPIQAAMGQFNPEITQLVVPVSHQERPAPEAQLRAAAAAGDVKGVREILDSDYRLGAPELGSALQWAARNNHGPDTLEIARALMDAGADVDHWDEWDPHTAVSSAAQTKNIELLRFLIEARADPTIGYGGGNSPMWLCSMEYLGDAERAVSELLKSARPRQLDTQTLVAAASAGASDLVRQALEAGVDANVKCKVGESDCSALIAAASCKDLNTLKLLLASGARPNCKDESQTPLRAAVLVNDEAAVRELIAAGADINERNAQGEDLVDFAYWCGNRELAQFLIQTKSKPESVGLSD